MTIPVDVSDELAARFAALPDSERALFRERVNAFAVAALSSAFAEAAVAYTDQDDAKVAAGVADMEAGRVRPVRDAFAAFAARNGFADTTLP